MLRTLNPTPDSSFADGLDLDMGAWGRREEVLCGTGLHDSRTAVPVSPLGVPMSQWRKRTSPLSRFATAEVHSSWNVRSWKRAPVRLGVLHRS